MVPVSVRYGCRTIDVTARSVVVAVSTNRCLLMRYSAGLSTMLVGVEAVTVIVTVVGGEDVPFTFVATTLKV